MGFMATRRKARQGEKNRRQHRRKKLALLRLHYSKARSEAEKKRILVKVFSVTPYLRLEEFVKSVSAHKGLEKVVSRK